VTTGYTPGPAGSNLDPAGPVPATSNPDPTGSAVTKSQEVAVEQAVMVMSGITKRFGGVAALTDVSFQVRPGEVHALLGENGAGKSTLMAVASGVTTPDGGTVAVADTEYHSLTPALATELGIAIVHQHPALLPDLTVAENMRVAIPRPVLRAGNDEPAKIRELLERVGLRVHLEERVESLSVAQKHLLECAKALAVSPRVLILDEPTAALGHDSVDLLFTLVRSAAEAGVAVIYITHRLAEVRQLADWVTVLRDGKVRASAPADELSDDQLLALIVGRQLDATFPEKHEAQGDEPVALGVADLSGDGFKHVNLEVRRGEIVGIAGIVGNGQGALLRALAGLRSFEGAVTLNGQAMTPKRLAADAAYLPADRQGEGLLTGMSVRENAAVTALPAFKSGLFLNRGAEQRAVGRELAALAVKAPSADAPVAALSGGNQQKVVLARALMAKPKIMVADEPTQGVDVGARAEIYRILRDVSESGVPVVIASSDAKELEGLCDRVVVMSRGQSVETLTGSRINEENIIRATLHATAHTQATAERTTRTSTGRVQRFIRGDYAPVLILAIVMLGLGAYVYAHNSRYLASFNITAVMINCAALGFIAVGQTIPLMMAGIDLSVGPLAGMLVVIASFFVNDGRAGPVMLLGFVLIFAVSGGAGALNASLIRFGRFTPVAATLATYIGFQGLSFLMRQTPGGFINSTVADNIQKTVGPVPIAFIGLVAVVLAMEFALRWRPWGLRVRAVGSDAEAARRVGIKVTRTIVGGYIAAASFVGLGAVVLLAQLGVGDPAQGVGFTLSSITAVVLGGTSLLGGRGTFIGTLLGAGLIVQCLNATTFLSLSQTWQYIFQGVLILVAAVIYSQVRGQRLLPSR
jgi:ribose transport system ATP-binding protein